MVKRALEWWLSIWGLGLRPGSPSAWLFALGCVVLATLVREALGLVGPDSALFASYYSATLVAALVAGAAAGSVAAVAGGLVALWLFVPPDWMAAPFVKEQVIGVLTFAISSLVIIWAAESYRGVLLRLREEEGTRRLLNHELDHRIKNVLASVQAIVNETLREQPESRDRIGARIAALGATNDLLMRSEWSGASLRTILSSEFAPYGLTRFVLDGEDVECPAGAAIPLALIVHELTTNASKYGALSTAGGGVDVSWRCAGDRLRLAWVERGGPPPQPPTRSGFGTKLLRRSVRQFDGTVDIQYAPSGLELRLSLRLPPKRARRALAKTLAQSARDTAAASAAREVP
ncbi:MAG TPA: sensor histidine kinase [Xanthobacteraceae bacterium]|nr:sensor histidine kinase [Xanthobacteraceae bacterium]